MKNIRSVQVGTGAIIVNNKKILLAQRKGPHGTGMWGTVGGHVEFGECPSDEIVREAKEELGIRLGNV